MFRKLSAEEEIEFREYARENYAAGTKISEVWHPATRDECEKINEEQLKETRQSAIAHYINSQFECLQLELLGESELLSIKITSPHGTTKWMNINTAQAERIQAIIIEG